MRLAIIACRVFGRELSYYAALSGNTCSIYWLEQGLHNTPEQILLQAQQAIDEIDHIQLTEYSNRTFDAIVLGYGLCSNGVVGLSSKTLPIVVPKTDDCIAIFLGSQARYLKEFYEHSGTYWFSPGWIEFGSVPSEKLYHEAYDRYCEKYGEDNAEYLMQAERTWAEKYDNCIYINSTFLDNEPYIDSTKQSAIWLNCKYSALNGDDRMIKALVSGEWGDDFLICPKGHKIVATNDEQKLASQPIE